MKRKIILISAVLALVLVCLAACNGTNETLANVTKLIKADYSVITLNVTTEKDDVTLYGSYTFTFGDETTTVKYSYDRFNELNLDGNNAPSYKETVKGTATVYEDGTVMVDGEVVELPLAELSFTGLSFKEAFFANAKYSTETFEADVTNPRGFTGNNSFVCSDMHVKVSFNANSLSVLTIKYVSSSNADVLITYLFVK